MDQDPLVIGPYMWEMQRGSYLFGREIDQIVVNTEFGTPDHLFLYESGERSAKTLIWSGWAWERVVDVVTQDEC